MAGHFVENKLGFDPKTLGPNRKEGIVTEPSGFSEAVRKLMEEAKLSEAEAKAVAEQTFKQVG